MLFPSSRLPDFPSSHLPAFRKTKRPPSRGWMAASRSDRLESELAPPFFSLVPPTVARSGGHGWGFSVDSQAGWPSHLVHHCWRCESGQVADRPFTRHPEAPDRGGRGTRLAPPVQLDLSRSWRQTIPLGSSPISTASPARPRFARRTNPESAHVTNRVDLVLRLAANRASA